MSQKKERYAGKVLTGFIFGAIAGAAAALLLTPKSGIELRGNLNRQTISLKKKGSDLATKAKEKSSSLAKNVSDSPVVNKVRERTFKQSGAERHESSRVRLVPKDYDDASSESEN